MNKQLIVNMARRDGHVTVDLHIFGPKIFDVKRPVGHSEAAKMIHTALLLSGHLGLDEDRRPWDEKLDQFCEDNRLRHRYNYYDNTYTFFDATPIPEPRYEEVVVSEEVVPVMTNYGLTEISKQVTFERRLIKTDRVGQEIADDPPKKGP